MAGGESTLLFEHLRALLESERLEPLGDRELLRRFLSRRDQMAFVALVQRHGGMVLKVCRRVLHQEQDAEDAFQATFLVLTRKGASLRGFDSLGGWLHGVARRLALELRRKVRRHAAVHPSKEPTTPDPLDEITGRELLTVLDEELTRLPEKYRVALVLCHLEGRTQEEAARQLAWSLSMLRRRLERGQALLRARLTRRGLEWPAALLAGTLAANATAAPPPILVVSLLRTVAPLPGNPAAAVGGVSDRVLALVNGLRTGFAPGKSALIAAVVFTASALAAKAWLLGSQGAQGPTQPVSTAILRQPDQPEAERDQPARRDGHDDALPPGAVARLGTVRLRHRAAAVTFAADGKTLVSAGVDGTLRFWDLDTGREMRRRRLEGAVPAPDYLFVARAPDGRAIAGWHGPNLYVWDGTTGRLLRRIDARTLRPWRFAVSPGGKAIAAVPDPRSNPVIDVWDVDTGAERLVLKDHKAADNLAFSPDGTMLASASLQTGVRLWDVQTGAVLRSFPGPCETVAFSPDGKRLAAGRPNGTLRIWDVAGGKELNSLADPAQNGLSTMAFSPDGRLLAAGGMRTTVVWDLTTHQVRHRLADHWGGWLVFAPDGKILASSGGSGIRLWEVRSGKRLLAPTGHEEWITSLAASANGRFLVSTSGDKRCLWDPGTGRLLAHVPEQTTQARGAAFSADGKLIVGDADGALHLWETATGKRVKSLSFNGSDRGMGRGPVSAFCLAPEGKRLAAITLMDERHAAHELVVWDLASATAVVRRAISSAGFQFAFTPDGEAVLTWTKRGLVLEDVATGRALLTLPGDVGPPVVCSPDGQIFAVAGVRPLPPGVGAPGGGPRGRVDAVCLIERASGRRFLRIETGEFGHNLLAFSPDGHLLATADREAFHVWDTTTGKELLRRPLHERLVGPAGYSFVTALAFLPGGSRLATGFMDGTVLIWDLGPATRQSGAAQQRLDREHLNTIWTDLADDSAKAHRAMAALAADGAGAISLLRVRVRPVGAADSRRVQRLVADLENGQFAVREAATRELVELGELGEPTLRRALQGRPSLELRQRVDGLLGQTLLAARGVVRSSEILRTLRAIQVLERVRSPEARAVLARLAEGAPAARVTREARAALERIRAADR
jgi:RNA polymerase sigma factor (sigma-70 family)